MAASALCSRMLVYTVSMKIVPNIHNPQVTFVQQMIVPGQAQVKNNLAELQAHWWHVTVDGLVPPPPHPPTPATGSLHIERIH